MSSRPALYPEARRTKGSGGAPIRHCSQPRSGHFLDPLGGSAAQSGFTFDDAATVGAGPDSAARASHRGTRKNTLLSYCDTARVRASEGRANRLAVRAASLAPRTISAREANALNCAGLEDRRRCSRKSDPTWETATVDAELGEIWGSRTALSGSTALAVA